MLLKGRVLGTALGEGAGLVRSGVYGGKTGVDCMGNCMRLPEFGLDGLVLRLAALTDAQCTAASYAPAP